MHISPLFSYISWYPRDIPIPHQHQHLRDGHYMMHHNTISDICNHPANLGYPHDYGNLQMYCTWLVVGTNPSEKYESIGMIRTPIYGNIKLMFQTTNQRNMQPSNLFNPANHPNSTSGASGSFRKRLGASSVHHIHFGERWRDTDHHEKHRECRANVAPGGLQRLLNFI